MIYDKKLKPWSIVVAVAVSLFLLWLYIINPLHKDFGMEPLLATILCLSLSFVASFLPYLKRNKNLNRLLYGALLFVVFGILYFFIL
jgi:hypothetical protein